MSEQSDTQQGPEEEVSWPAKKDEIEIESPGGAQDEGSEYGGADQSRGPDGPDEQDEDQGI